MATPKAATKEKDATEDGGRAANGAAIEVENPASGEAIGSVPNLGQVDVAGLVERARAAQPGWNELGFEGRGAVLAAAARWLAVNDGRVVETIVAETGKSWDDAYFAELIYAINAFGFWAAKAPEYLADEEVETANPFVRGRRLVARYAPLGVVGVIGPWNYPLTNSFGDCIPALAAGNSVVLKPSEQTPLTSLLMGEMLAECGLPDGAFAVATGDGETGAALIDEVDYAMFTGSTETGKKVMERAARTLTPVGLELGGKDPMIVLADADLDRAATAAVHYGMSNAGQTCISIERVYVEDAVHDEFVARVAALAGGLRLGPPGGPGAVDVGAITFPPQIDLISEHVADAVERGAEVLVGGERGEGPGRFYEPTVLTGVDHSMRCMTEETFGPVLPVMRVGDVEEALRLANEGPYGLAASVWTRDTRRGEELARRVEAGACCVNDAQLNYAVLELPMGGWKASGLGTRHGADGIRKYTARQALLVTPAHAPPRDAHMFPYAAETTMLIEQAVSFAATSDVLTPAQRRTLTALCDTFVPALEPPVDVDEADPDDADGFWGRAASHLAVPEAVEQAIAQMPVEQQRGLAGLLDSLAEHGMAPEAPQAARERIVHGFAEAGPEALAGITALRGLTTSLAYALPDLGTGRNRFWDAMGYPGPRRVPPAVEKPLRMRRPEGGELTLEADVCVVGSGAGGGVIAGELAGAGRRVCVLEMGGYFNESDFNQLELWAYQNMYLNGGPFPTAEGQVSIQAGSSVGGGTTINWTNCLRTHPWVREEWARDFGLEGLDGAAYDAHLDAVLERLGANDRCSDLNGVHKRLAAGCEKLGYEFTATVRNTDPDSYDPEAAGLMGFGDVSGSKQSTAKTYLADAQAGDAEIVARCRAERILVEGGRAAGVEGTYAAPDGTTAKVTVRAPTVVVACGAIESPALLLRSGIGGPAVGDNLRLHPTAAITGIYGEPVDWWWGPPQAAISHQFADLEEGYGFLIESAQATTGIFAAASPWRSGRDHKETMLAWDRAAPFINLTRDRGHGRVVLGPGGRGAIQYLLSDELDVRNVRRGLVEMTRIHEAAGAERIGSGARKLDFWERGQDLEEWIAQVEGSSLAPLEMGIFSAHQMGSCRMGTDPETSVAGPWGELHDTKGVWIGDASAFPTASGTNPMLTIMALARRTAEAIAAG